MSAVSTDQLASWRARGTRASEQTVKQGLIVLHSGGYKKMGNDAWSFLEQLALASLDIGRLDIADECIEQLVEEFPGSPRVECLKGIRIEAGDKPQDALNFYEAALVEDDTNVALWKRQIAVLRSQGSHTIQKAVEELTRYLDIFYTDVEAWTELSDIYAELNLYTLSLQSLAHVLVLASQNPFYVLRFAETAYTAGDIPLALKTYLRVIDMDEPDPVQGNAAKRAWWGLKTSATRLLSSPSLPSESQTQPPSAEHLRLLDELATEQLAEVYRSTSAVSQVQGRDVFLAWLSGPNR
ncbi:TPR-like protein [Hysterangium stoloniferum]|nr:TPR-like protein [Hysterangium stoloniferum]